MSSLHDRIVLPIGIKEAIYISPITGGTTKINIKEFVANFPIHTKKSEHGDFYPTSFRIRVISEIGIEYDLKDLQFIAPDQERSERFATFAMAIINLKKGKNVKENTTEERKEHY